MTSQASLSSGWWDSSWAALGCTGQEGGSEGSHGDPRGPAERRQSPPCLCGQEVVAALGPSLPSRPLCFSSLFSAWFSLSAFSATRGHLPTPEFSSGQLVRCPQGPVTLVRGVQRGPCKVIDSEHGWEGPRGAWGERLSERRGVAEADRREEGRWSSRAPPRR